MGFAVAAGLIPLVSETQNGLMMAGYMAKRTTTSTKIEEKFVELFKVKKIPNCYFDCFVGVTKNHQDVFSLSTLHTYNTTQSTNVISSNIIDNNANLTFYYNKNQDDSISVFIKSSNNYYFTFVIPISFYNGSFEYVMKGVESLPESSVPVSTSNNS